MKLGQLIKQVREIVPYSSSIPLKGLTSEKCFVDIELNQEGLKDKKFQLVRKNQFCYGAGHLSNFGKNILIAHNETEIDLTLSTTYTSFEIINLEILLPKYLMMWFLRDRFNHLVHWFSEGSHSELFSWQNLCNLPIRVPPPSQQEELVRKYNVTEKLINLKREINETLEKWMGCYYHILFDNLPEEQLEQKKLGDLLTIVGGGDPPKQHIEYFCKEGGIPWIRIQDLIESNKFIARGKENITEEGFKVAKCKWLPENSFLFARLGYKGQIKVANNPICIHTNLIGLISKNIKSLFFNWFLLKRKISKIFLEFQGTVIPHIRKTDLKEFLIDLPSQALISQFNQTCEPFFQLQKANEREIRELVKLQKYFIEQTN